MHQELKELPESLLLFEICTMGIEVRELILFALTGMYASACA